MSAARVASLVFPPPQKADGAASHRSILANLLATLVFFSPNCLNFIPTFHANLWGIIFFYDAVIIFLLVGVISHLKFQT